jgi:hypothetical protein
MAKKVSAKKSKISTKGVPRKSKMGTLLEKLPGGRTGESQQQAYNFSSVPRHLYVDYDTIQVDANNPDILHGYWARLPSEACAKITQNYVHRMDLVDYELYSDCPGSNSGIWKFTLAD